ncbi:helix-turn-helix domain-containing protein [Mycolicibacter hiberniae]|uniref:HTH cro/C1-type domain-containing protein n=1 Tax=Mycolicibacter hiberniae TaxID=29314 RepID=A0A7I7WZ21_9MYCO|nr:helix-turn-helix transcriptional regulator [Mycolicibacter hiberniae]MCV7086556.1 helix-turn-helix transcriptional regulator [Mycolicibacter hiberniae]BBZ22135.1 hypothetical protein MHIB_05530 [Mycolicibacter hiberniae]
MAETKPGRQLGPTGEAVRANIRSLRDRERISGAELSARLKKIGRPIPPLGIQRIEAGSRRVDTDDLVALAVALGVSPIRLLMPESAEVDDQVVQTGREPESARRGWEWLQGAFVPGDDETPNPAAWPSWRTRDVLRMFHRGEDGDDQ